MNNKRRRLNDTKMIDLDESDEESSELESINVNSSDESSKVNLNKFKYKYKNKKNEKKAIKLLGVKPHRGEHTNYCNFDDESIQGLCILIGMLGMHAGSSLAGSGIHNKGMFIFIYIL